MRPLVRMRDGGAYRAAIRVLAKRSQLPVTGCDSNPCRVSLARALSGLSETWLWSQAFFHSDEIYSLDNVFSPRCRYIRLNFLAANAVTPLEWISKPAPLSPAPAAVPPTNGRISHCQHPLRAFHLDYDPDGSSPQP